MRFISHWPLGVPLLFLAYLPGGTRPAGGFRRLFAYTQRKVLGMRTLATAITAGCSSLLRRGNRSADERSRTLRALVSSYSGHGLSIDATATRGASGALPATVSFAEAA